jgi:hypothetical protein
MAYIIAAGLQISLDGITYYKLTDHNREQIQISPSLIEKSQRMANGTLRKYVIGTKNVLSVSWSYVPSKSSLTVDGNYSSAWLQSFYNSNAGLSIYVKLVASRDDAALFAGYPLDSTFGTALTKEKVYNVFITNFGIELKHRTRHSDFVSMNIEFTEV